MFGSKRRCNDQLSKCGTQRSIFKHVSHIITSYFFIRKVNTERKPHTCWLSHTHVKCIIKSVSIMNVYGVPDAKMVILYQSGQTRVIFAFLTFKSFSSRPPPLRFRFNFILSKFLVLVVLTAFFNRNKKFCFFSCWTGGMCQCLASFSSIINRHRPTDFKRMNLHQITIRSTLWNTVL